TEEMKKWGKISFAITANEDKGLYRAYFYKENGDIIKIEVSDYVNGKFLKEGADIPPDTHTIDIVVGGDSSGNFFANPILTLGDVIGDDNEAYADNLLQDKTLGDFIKINHTHWRQGSLLKDVDYDDAKNNDISRVTVKKEHALKSGSNNIHFMIPSNLMIAIVQYDLNGKSIYNSGFIGSLYIEKIKGYFDTGKIEIISGAYETFAILAYKDSAPITPYDIHKEPIYIGTKEIKEIDVYTYRKIIGGENHESLKENQIPCPIYQPSYLYKYIGHGGLEDYAPSMSVEAYELAALFGMWGIESDAHLTKDNEIVMLHDTTVDRTTNGTGNVADLTLSEIKKLKITKGKELSEYDYDLRVPTIDEYLKICVDNQMYAQIEIKGGVPDKEALIDKLIEKLERYNMIEKTMLIAFQEATLQLVRNKHSQIWVSRIYNGDVTQSDIARWKELGNFILFNYNPTTDLNEETINLLNENNIPYLHGVR